MEDIREATSNSIYSIIYKKANRFNINIASPIIVLPLSTEADASVWVLRLGDLNIRSLETLQTTSVVEYERFEMKVEQIRMQHFQTMRVWNQQLSDLKKERGASLKSLNDYKYESNGQK